MLWATEEKEFVKKEFRADSLVFTKPYSIESVFEALPMSAIAQSFLNFFSQKLLQTTKSGVQKSLVVKDPLFLFILSSLSFVKKIDKTPFNKASVRSLFKRSQLGVLSIDCNCCPLAFRLGAALNRSAVYN